MQYAGSNVNLTITVDSINLMVMESGEVSKDQSVLWKLRDIFSCFSEELLYYIPTYID